MRNGGAASLGSSFFFLVLYEDDDYKSVELFAPFYFQILFYFFYKKQKSISKFGNLELTFGVIFVIWEKDIINFV